LGNTRWVITRVMIPCFECFSLPVGYFNNPLRFSTEKYTYFAKPFGVFIRDRPHTYVRYLNDFSILLSPISAYNAGFVHKIIKDQTFTSTQIVWGRMDGPG